MNFRVFKVAITSSLLESEGMDIPAIVASPLNWPNVVDMRDFSSAAEANRTSALKISVA